MKIGIHYTKAEWSFCHAWIAHCEQQNIAYKLVNAYDSDIVSQLEDCEAFMWHHNQVIHKDTLFAKQLLFSLEAAGKRVFPNYNTGWHFDDKVGQKYLLEAMGISLAPSYVFYEWEDAKAWIEGTTFPKVFKLRGGAGSTNVRLVRSKEMAFKLAKKMINRGISSYDKKGDVKETYRCFKLKKASLKDLLKSIARLVVSTPYARKQGKEIGYAYFQEFIPNDGYDIRVIVMGGRAFGAKRFVRENDFRASGSGFVAFERENMDERCVRMALDITRQMKAQSVAYDFVIDKNNTPHIVEISYCFNAKYAEDHAGYWDEEMIWHEGTFNPLQWIVDELIK